MKLQLCASVGSEIMEWTQWWTKSVVLFFLENYILEWDMMKDYGHVYAGSPRRGAVRFVGEWPLHAFKGYHLSTPFVEGPSEPKRGGDVATSRALIGSQKRLNHTKTPSLFGKTAQQLFSHWQTPMSKCYFLSFWWLTGGQRKLDRYFK